MRSFAKAFFVTMVSVFAFSDAHADFICLANAAGTQVSVTLTPRQGDPQVVRIAALSNACADMGPDLQPFEVSVSAFASECVNKAIFPGETLVIRMDESRTTCGIREGLQNIGTDSTRKFVKLKIHNTMASTTALVKLQTMKCAWINLLWTRVGPLQQQTVGTVFDLDSDCGMRSSLAFTFQYALDIPRYKPIPYPFSISLSEQGGLQCQTTAPAAIASCLVNGDEVTLNVNRAE